MDIVSSYLVPFVVGVVVTIAAWKAAARLQRVWLRSAVRASVIALFFTPTIILIPIDSHTTTTAVHYAWLAILGGITGADSRLLLCGVVPMFLCGAVLTGIFRLYGRAA